MFASCQNHSDTADSRLYKRFLYSNLCGMQGAQGREITVPCIRQDNVRKVVAVWQAGLAACCSVDSPSLLSSPRSGSTTTWIAAFVGRG
eukprot:SAG31_NODE_1622_length_7722_cov_4.332940_2_plen_89_part_00